MQNFSRWCTTQLVQVTIHPTVAVATVWPAIMAFLARQPPRRRMCFDNALALARAIPGVRYVVGRASVVLGDHAWNELDGIHFDVTAEFAYETRLDLGDYQAIVAMTYEEARVVTPFRAAPTLPDIWMWRNNVEHAKQEPSEQ